MKSVAREEANCLLSDRELLPLSSEGTMQFRRNFCGVSWTGIRLLLFLRNAWEPPGWRGLQLPNSPPHGRKRKSELLAATTNEGKRLCLTNEGNCFFSRSTAFASMELGDFAFKAACSLWLLVLGAFYCPWRRTLSQRDLTREEHRAIVVMFSLSSGVAALANCQYWDRFSPRGFSSASAVPLGVLWLYYWYGKLS